MKTKSIASILNFVVGEKREGLQQVDIWCNELLLTPLDNMVYLPQFIAALKYELQALESNQFDDGDIFLDLGPTTDDFSARIKLKDQHAEITIEIENQPPNLFVFELEQLKLSFQSIIEDLQTLN